jgi:hypothetical protein
MVIAIDIPNNNLDEQWMTITHLILSTSDTLDNNLDEQWMTITQSILQQVTLPTTTWMNNG